MVVVGGFNAFEIVFEFRAPILELVYDKITLGLKYENPPDA